MREIAIVDYHKGNLSSVRRGIEAAGGVARVTDDPEVVASAGTQGIPLGSLGNRIRSRFPDFKVSDYGYTQFKKYIQSFPDIAVVSDGEQNWAVHR